MGEVINFYTLIKNNEVKELREMAESNPRPPTLEKDVEYVFYDFAEKLCELIGAKKTIDMSLAQDCALRVIDMVEATYDS